MQNAVPPGVENRLRNRLELCPVLRYVRAHGNSILREFSRAQTREARDGIQNDAATLAAFIINVAGPLAGALHLCGQEPAEYRDAFDEIAESLKRIVPCNPELAPWNFPEDDGQRLILDRLEAIEEQLREVLTRRKTRRFHLVEVEMPQLWPEAV